MAESLTHASNSGAINKWANFWRQVEISPRTKHFWRRIEISARMIHVPTATLPQKKRRRPR